MRRIRRTFRGWCRQMAKLEIFRRTDRNIAHMDEMRPFLAGVARRVAARAQAILDTESKVRTGDSQIRPGSGKLDGYITITDKTPPGARTPADKIAWVIQAQKQALYRALEEGL